MFFRAWVMGKTKSLHWKVCSTNELTGLPVLSLQAKQVSRVLLVHVLLHSPFCKKSNNFPLAADGQCSQLQLGVLVLFTRKDAEGRYPESFLDRNISPYLELLGMFAVYTWVWLQIGHTCKTLPGLYQKGRVFWAILTCRNPLEIPAAFFTELWIKRWGLLGARFLKQLCKASSFIWLMKR